MITREQIKKAINTINLGSDSFKEETRILGNAILDLEEEVLQNQDKLQKVNQELTEKCHHNRELLSKERIT